MNFRIIVLTMCSVLAASPAGAQSFNQAIIFGDSSVDSGYFKALPNPGGGAIYNSYWASAVAAGAGAPTTSPGLVNSQFLASYFGLTANPANQIGGTDFATSGAKDVTVNTAATGGFGAAIPTVTQISDYLSQSNGRANPNALYLISSGGNDVTFALGQSGTGPFPSNPTAYLVSAANSLAASVASLQAAGARYVIVPDLAYSFPAADPTAQQLKLTYSQTLWTGLAAAGVNFIPADFNAVRLAIAANPASFGFVTVGTGPGQMACTQPAGVTTAWALLCSSNPAAPSHLVSPNAEQIYLFADDQHYTTAGQKIEADYYYSLVVAPSEISYLAETAVQTTLDLVNGIQQQIDLSQRQRTSGWNVWANGQLSYLQLTNSAQGFPGDPGSPISGTIGLDYRWQNGWLAGVAISQDHVESSFSLGGDFRQDDTVLSLYTAYRSGAWWGDVVGSTGWLDYATNRLAPIGITVQANNGSTNGTDLSLAGEAGYDFRTGSVIHGPVAGLILQRVSIAGFTESGSFTSLSFGSQSRDSEVSALGYRMSFDWANWSPFAQVTWNHEFDSMDRNVIASLTTIAAPSYSMPAVVLGRDWATTTIGVRVKLASAWTGLGSVTAQLGQNNAMNYSALVGVNYAIDRDPKIVTKY
jgi:outer membrane lipase/esterase